MNLTIRLLGAEVLHVSTQADEQQQGAGDATAMPMGFTVSHGDARWEKGLELE